MERQTEPPINPKAKKKEEEEKGENQKTTMACIGIEIKERIERGKKNVPQGRCTARRRRVPASEKLETGEGEVSQKK